MYFSIQLLESHNFSIFIAGLLPHTISNTNVTVKKVLLAKTTFHELINLLFLFHNTMFCSRIQDPEVIAAVV